MAMMKVTMIIVMVCDGDGDGDGDGGGDGQLVQVIVSRFQFEIFTPHILVSSLFKRRGFLKLLRALAQPSGELVGFELILSVSSWEAPSGKLKKVPGGEIANFCSKNQINMSLKMQPKQTEVSTKQNKKTKKQTEAKNHRSDMF